MEIYLAVITTVLVITQIIRLVQNTIQLERLESKNIKVVKEWVEMRESIDRIAEIAKGLKK